MPEVKTKSMPWAAWALMGLPIVATLLPKALTVYLAVLGGVAIYGAWRGASLKDVFPRWALVFAALAGAWMVYRAAFPFDGEQSLEKVVRYFGLVLLGFAAVYFVRTLSEEARDTSRKALIVGCAVSLAVILVGCIVVKLDVKQQIPIQRADRLSIFNTGVIALVLLLPSVSYFLSRRMGVKWAVGYAAVLSGVVVFIGSSTALGALLIGGVVFVSVKKFGQQFTKLLATLCVVATVAFPVGFPLMMDRLHVASEETHINQDLATAYDFLGSLGHRYFIWNFALEKALERPIEGWGFDKSRAIPGGHETFDIGKELMPLHPHNGVLQVWLELGLPGLIVLAAVVWLLFNPPRHAPGYLPVHNIVRTVTVSMLFGIVCVAFGVWQSWWVALVLLVLAVLFMFEKPAEDP